MKLSGWLLALIYCLNSALLAVDYLLSLLYALCCTSFLMKGSVKAPVLEIFC